jgi:hypothetical protein
MRSEHQGGIRQWLEIDLMRLIEPADMTKLLAQANDSRAEAPAD